MDSIPRPQNNLKFDYYKMVEQIRSETISASVHAPFLYLIDQIVFPSPPFSSLLHLLLSVSDGKGLDQVTRILLSETLSPLLQIMPSKHQLLSRLSSASMTQESVSTSRSSEIIQSLMHSGSAFLSTFDSEEEEEGTVKQPRMEMNERNLGIPFECVVCHSSQIDDSSHFPGYFCRYYRLSGESKMKEMRVSS